MTEITKIKKLAKFCKEQGITRLKTADVEIEFSLSSPATPEPKPKTEAHEPKFEPAKSSPDAHIQMPGDDEMLFYATDAFDSLRKSREVS